MEKTESGVVLGVPELIKLVERYADARTFSELGAALGAHHHTAYKWEAGRYTDAEAVRQNLIDRIALLFKREAGDAYKQLQTAAAMPPEIARPLIVAWIERAERDLAESRNRMIASLGKPIPAEAGDGEAEYTPGRLHEIGQKIARLRLVLAVYDEAAARGVELGAWIENVKTPSRGRRRKGARHDDSAIAA